MDLNEPGDAALSTGDFSAAHRHWTAAIIDDPSNARAYSNRSMVRLAYFSDVTGALQDAEAAVAADRSYVPGFVRLEAALRHSEGDGQFGKLAEIFLEKDFNGSNSKRVIDHSGNDPNSACAHSVAKTSELYTTIQAIIASGDRDNASEADVANSKALKNLREQVLVRTKEHINVKLPAVESWVERISRRFETKLTKESRQPPDAIVADPSATDLASGLLALPTALIRLIISYWDFVQRTIRTEQQHYCSYVDKLPLIAMHSLRGASRIGFHVVTRKMLAPLVSSCTFTWERLALTPADVLGSLEKFDVALASERSFRDDDDDYTPCYGFGGGEDGEDEEDGYYQSDNALLVGCLLKACGGNRKNACAVRVLNFHGNLRTKTACAIGAFCPRLQCLIFNNVTVSSKSFGCIASGCPLLKTLKVGRYGADDEMLRTLSRACPLLRHLSCESCKRVSDHGLFELSEACLDLCYVDVTRSSVSDAGVAHLVNRCRGLRTLHLSGCTNVSIVAFEALPLLINDPDIGRRSELMDLTVTSTACQGEDIERLKMDCLPYDVRVKCDKTT